MSESKSDALPLGYEAINLVVERDGFEPSKSATADLQSAPFGHSGTYPNIYIKKLELVDGQNRTPCVFRARAKALHTSHLKTIHRIVF